MNIAVAGVKDVGNSNIESSRDTLDEAKDMRQERPRHDAVLGAKGRAQPANGPKADLRLFQMATYSGSLRVRQVIDF